MAKLCLINSNRGGGWTDDSDIGGSNDSEDMIGSADIVSTGIVDLLSTDYETIDDSMEEDTTTEFEGLILERDG